MIAYQDLTKMKKLFIIFCFCFINNSAIYSQPIPYGDSMDNLLTSDSTYYDIYYYKPANYDSASSPILWGIHGAGGYGGAGERNFLRSIADNRKALIVAPTFVDYGYVHGWSNGVRLPYVFKEIYKHVLTRENRDSVWVHLIGMSAGGQCVTRYMLIRQALLDSIPIRMAVSTNPFSYTFCTDSLNGVPMDYPCGLNSSSVDFICENHVITYYNENYGVLIGTADTSATSNMMCQESAQGAHRYERALNFYNFSDTDAVSRGTNLKWQYAEVPGVGHNTNLMYNTKADPTDTASIAESLLFDSPYYPPLYSPPCVGFKADRTLATVGDNINFTDYSFSTPTSWQWSFPGGTPSSSTAQNPTVTYDTVGIYSVTLIAANAAGGDTLVKSNYIYIVNQRWNALGDGLGCGWAVYDLAVYNNELYAGGYFNINKQDSSYGIAVLSDTAWLSIEPGGVDTICGAGRGRWVKSNDLNPGIYFYSLMSDRTRIETKKMVHLK